MEALFVGENAIFYGALLAVLILGAVELAALLCVGAGFSDAMHALVHTGADHHADLPDSINWLVVKNLPLMVVVVLVLSGFGFTGLGLRRVATSLDYALPLSYAIGAGVIGGLLTMRLVGALIAPLFGLRTDAVSLESLAGSTALVVGATATAARAGEARLTDKFGHTHYLQIIPQNPDDEFADGQEVVLTELDGHRYKVVAKQQSV